MFKRLLQGLSGSISRWNHAKFRVVKRLLQRTDEFTNTIPNRYTVGRHDAVVIRNALCACIDTAMVLAGNQMEDLDKDFSVTPDRDDIVRSWFAVLHLGSLLFAIADRHSDGKLDDVSKFAFSIGLIGHAFVYEDPWCTDAVIDAILEHPNPKTAAAAVFQQRLQSVLGYPKRQETLSLHSMVLPHIVAAASAKVENPEWSSEVDAWIAHAKADMFEA